MKKLSALVQSVMFYGFNLIVGALFFDINNRKSIEDLFLFGGTVLAVIAALAGLCYGGAPCNQTDKGKRVFAFSGHRFLHCFLSLVFAMFFIGAGIQIQSKGIWGFHNSTLATASRIIAGLMAVISLLWAVRSFSVGYHMIRRLLDETFPFEDERLFDDLKKEL